MKKRFFYLLLLLSFFACKKEEIIRKVELRTLTVMPCKVADRRPLGYFGLGDPEPHYHLIDSKGKTFTVYSIKNFDEIFEQGIKYVIELRSEYVVEIRGREPYIDEYHEPKHILEKIISSNRENVTCASIPKS